MSFARKRDWRICVCLAVVTLWLTASPLAFAGPENVPPMKPVIAGFIDMQTITWHNTDDSTPTFTLNNVNQFPGVFGGIVLNATWAEMQPEPGGPLITARIDAPMGQGDQRRPPDNPAKPDGMSFG
jgi:hypothetical protein